MSPKLQSLLNGAACAAFLILPTLGAIGPAQAFHTDVPSPPAPPSPPPAPPAPPAPQWRGNAAGGEWMTWPMKSYTANSVKFDNIVGTVIVNVRDSGPMTVQASGMRARLNGLSVSAQGGRLEIDGSEVQDSQTVWDWRHWFDFSNMTEPTQHNLSITVTVPRGTDVNVEDLVGNATIGDTQGMLHFEAAATNARIGRVSTAKIELGGDGKIDIAQVTGTLKLDVGGSGKITVGSTGNVNADIAGSGDVRLGAIAGGLDLDIAGSGDVTAAHVNGPVKVSIAGSGSVKIADGTADPLHVEIMGAGNFDFGGVAVDPHIEAVGSGTVRLKSYRGHLSSEGMADVKIGQ